MSEFFTKALTWIKANMILAVVILFAGVVLFFPRMLKGLSAPRRVRHRPGYYTARSGRTIPRSVGLRWRPRSRPRKQYTKGGKAKKAWQIKGSLAAKRHMAQIRKMR